MEVNRVLYYYAEILRFFAKVELLFANSLPSFAKVLRLFCFSIITKNIRIFQKGLWCVRTIFWKEVFLALFYLQKNNLNYAEFLVTSSCPLSVRLSMLMLPVFSTSDKTFGGGGLIFSHQQKIIVSLEKLDSMILGMQWNNLNQKRQNYYWVKENQIVK